MRTCVLVTLLVGCFTPSPPAGAPCAPDGSCPSGQTCFAGVCREEAPSNGPDGAINDDTMIGPDGPPNDVDADGVENAMDNCPAAANMDQHDEDADARGDVCDNCPHVANAMQPNSDGDAVGDACDPNPATAGDTIQLFLPFNVVPVGVSTPRGNWAIQNDAYRNASNGNDAEILVAGVRDRVTVEIGAVVEQFHGQLWMAVSVGEHGNEPRFYDCGYLDVPAGNGFPADFHNGIIEYFDGNNFSLRAGNHELPSRLNGAFTIRTTANSVTNQVRCTTIDSRPTATTMDGAANNLEPGIVGVKAYGATFRVNYLVVFGLQ